MGFNTGVAVFHQGATVYSVSSHFIEYCLVKGSNMQSSGFMITSLNMAAMSYGKQTVAKATNG